MITIDSLKIKTPFHVLESIKDSDTWTENIVNKFGNRITDKSTLNGVGLGFKSVSIDHLKEEVHLELSAKVLHNDYSKLISVNTFDQMCDNINQSGVITVNPERLYNESELLKVDFCNNLNVSQDVNSYFPQMLAVRSNDKYKVDRYNKPKNKGVVVQGNQTSFKERLIMYNKLLDIQKDKDLCKTVPYSILERDFKDVLRVEQNTYQLKRIRHYASTKDNRLKTVLESLATPNYSLLKKATSKYFDLKLFNDYDDLKLYQIEKLEGRKRIIERCHFDNEIIKEFLQSKVSGNISQYLREYKSLAIQIQAENGIILEPEQNEHIKEILELLKVA